jgi:3-dehydroquinate synthase
LRIESLVRAAGLPIVAPDLGIERWLDLMEVDKKNEGGQIKFILLKPLGKSVITTVPQDMLIQTLHACVKGGDE